MRATTTGSMARQLELLFQRGTASHGDRALLEWFVAHGDESAFEALVLRHGPMVRGVCRRLLGSPHDADDAFQATFLVLVQKARSLRDSDRLGPWLYGVATRVATKARSRAATRRDRFATLVDDPPSLDDGPSTDWLDMRPILDAELGQLPARYRDVLVLCLLEGSTAEEAAVQLSCPLGTVKSRLARGREALRARLTGRGLAPAVVLGIVAGSAKSTVASVVPQTLLRTTLQTIAAFGSTSAGLSPSVVALTRGVAPSMFSKSSLMAAVAFGGLALSGLGISAWIRSPAMAQEPGAAAAGGPGAAKADPPKGDFALRRATDYHLRQILLAMHNYATKANEFPPAAIYSQDGKPLLSWRVALLPYLDEQKLYEEFHKDEPWDSPHNVKLLPRMPVVFTTPSAPAADHTTRFRGFQGKGAFFEGTTGSTFASFTDGLSNTLALTVSKEAQFWTMPGDMPFGEGIPLPDLAGEDQPGAFIAMADGSSRYLSKNTPKFVPFLNALITRNGGEIIEWPAAEPAISAEAPKGGGTPTPAANGIGGMPGGPGGAGMAAGFPPQPNAAALEQRLQRLEDKLDQVIQRLDAISPRPAGTPIGR